MKKAYSILAGALMALSCAFEFTTVKRYIDNIADGDSAYAGDLAVEIIYILGILAAAAFIVTDKSVKGAALSLALAGGVALYRTVTYVTGILGNEMIVSLVAGKIIEISEIIYFAVPVAVMLLVRDKLSDKSSRGFLICPLIAFLIGIGGRIVYFVGYGKSLFYDVGLLFQVYGADMAKTAVWLLAFGATVMSLMPVSGKKRR